MKKPNEDRQGVPPRRRDILFIQSPKGGERLMFTAYSPEFWGVYTHFNGGRTIPCFENHELCEGGHKELNLRWKGYLHGWSHSRNEPVFMQFTIEAANQILDQLASGQTLRGMKLRCERSNKTKGRMYAHVEEYTSVVPSAKLPPPVDPLRSLYNLWQRPYSEERLTRHLSGDPPDMVAILKTG